MKNLIFISTLFLIFSCGNETKTDTAKSVSTPIKTESPQMNTDSENPQNSTEEETKVLAKNEIEKEMKSEQSTTKVPAKNISSKTNKNSKPSISKPDTETIVKNEADAKAQIEAEKAKALSEKIRLEEEMRKAEAAKKAKEALDAKFKKERETVKKQKEVGGLFGSKDKKPAVAAGLHDNFDALLRKYVSSSGVVNYNGFKKEEAKLNAYLSTLEKTNIEKNWSRNKKLAFWINAYNAFTIKLILKNYPLKSIMDLNSGKPWDVKWIKIDQRTLSLNNIENDIIRPIFNEPRIHFAVNCAAKSCPPLLNKAWTANNLNSNLEKQTKSFINNSKYNTITANNVEVSKIFDWYKKDFGDLTTYLNKYSTTTIGKGTSVNFKTYNWELNN